jgi:hypothetical protein
MARPSAQSPTTFPHGSLAEDHRLTATDACANILPAMREAEKQFFITRAVALNRRDASSNFLPVMPCPTVPGRARASGGKEPL